MISFLLAAAVALVPGSGNIWTDGTHTWGGPAQCYEAGFSLSSDSSAIDYGVWVEGLHCPQPGPDPSGCVEWYGKAPDAGACEWFPDQPIEPTKPPNAPQVVTLE